MTETKLPDLMEALEASLKEAGATTLSPEEAGRRRARGALCERCERRPPHVIYRALAFGRGRQIVRSARRRLCRECLEEVWAATQAALEPKA